MSKDSREERKELFEETKRIYSTDKKLVDSISFSKQKLNIVDNSFLFICFGGV